MQQLLPETRGSCNIAIFIDYQACGILCGIPSNKFDKAALLRLGDHGADQVERDKE